ncbi:MAG: SH3 domain-containing protein [Myxococcota bacterium]
MKLTRALGVLFVVSACQSNEEHASTEPSPAAHEQATTTREPEPPPEPEQFVPGYALVSRHVSLRETSDKKSPRVGRLKRGDLVSLGEPRDNWVRVRCETDSPQEGWVEAKHLFMEEEGATLSAATTLNPIKTFLRPDLVAIDTKVSVEAGALLLARKRKGDFAEVNVGKGRVRWVTTKSLTWDSNEVGASQLWDEHEAVASYNPVAAGRAIREAHKKFSGAKVLGMMPAPEPIPLEKVRRSMVSGFWSDEGEEQMGHVLEPDGTYYYEGPMGDEGRWSYDKDAHTIALRIGLRGRAGPDGEWIKANPTDVLFKIIEYNEDTMSVRAVDCERCDMETWERQDP